MRELINVKKTKLKRQRNMTKLEQNMCKDLCVTVEEKWNDRIGHSKSKIICLNGILHHNYNPHSINTMQSIYDWSRTKQDNPREEDTVHCFDWIDDCKFATCNNTVHIQDTLHLFGWNWIMRINPHLIRTPFSVDWSQTVS